MADLFKDRYRIQSARCPVWDYRSNANYFITICTDQWDSFFGKIENKQVILSDSGHIAEKYWKELPNHFPFLSLDVFVVMPNHIHGIIILDGNFYYPYINHSVHKIDVGEDSKEKYMDSNKLRKIMSDISPKKGSVASVIRSYKSAVTKEINKSDPGQNFKWQSRYHDHIIRDMKSYQRIKNYILNNPNNWNEDIFYRY
jgi:REP element-mobilizing transposase RayT